MLHLLAEMYCVTGSLLGGRISPKMYSECSNIMFKLFA